MFTFQVIVIIVLYFIRIKYCFDLEFFQVTMVTLLTVT